MNWELFTLFDSFNLYFNRKWMIWIEWNLNISRIWIFCILWKIKMTKLTFYRMWIEWYYFVNADILFGDSSLCTCSKCNIFPWIDRWFRIGSTTSNRYLSTMYTIMAYVGQRFSFYVWTAFTHLYGQRLFHEYVWNFLLS